MSVPVTLRTYLEARRAEIDAALDGFLPTPPACPPRLAEAMRYSVFAGGKRLRPILTLAAADAVLGGRVPRGYLSPSRDAGGTSTPGVPDPRHLSPSRDAGGTGTPGVPDPRHLSPFQDPEGTGTPGVPDPRELALPAACAIEMIHTYSLIHDDLPAMDDDTLRRGRPTVHVVYGEGVAILAGDALLTEAFGVLARHPVSHDEVVERHKLRTLGRIAAAAGVVGMVGGQTLDLEAAAATERLDGDRLQTMHERKTGALIRVAAVSGAIMVGAADPFVEAVDCYAARLGLAFQIVDDILDIEGEADKLGKTAGKDAAAGKPTYPALYGIDESRRLAAQAVAEAQAVLADAGLGGRLLEIAEWVISRTN